MAGVMAAKVAATAEDGPSIGSADEATSAVARLRAEVAKLIVGQDEVVDDVLMTILAGGHGLLIGAPGLAKTLLVRSVAEAMHLDFRRIQFTPDLVPSDITGTELLDEDQETGQKSFRFVRGPVFANIILADEINRAPPRTQAAMLEAMQERTVTAAGRTMPLPRPFFVLATQNPIEQEGTYPLPEAQLDRFLFAINVGYPTLDEEMSILQSTTGRAVEAIEPVMRGEDVLLLQEMVRDVAVAEAMLRYVAELVRATRPGEEGLPERVRRYVRWGAGPRAGQALVLGAKVRALLEGRSAITPADVRRIAHPVLRHRVLVNFAAEADGVTAEEVIDDVLDHVPAPTSRIRI
jgi:MoxR-like ATPase